MRQPDPIVLRGINTDGLPGFKAACTCIDRLPEPQFGNGFAVQHQRREMLHQHVARQQHGIFVENIRNSSDVFAQLFAENGTEPLRSFFIPERGQFELPQLNAGRYQIRYRQLDGGEHVNSETIVLQGKQQEVTVYLQRGRAPVTY